MVSSEVSRLCKTLLSLKLVTQAQLDECLSELSHSATGAGQLIDVLDRKNVLTPYQVNHLRKEDLSSLVLGDYALLYQNASGSFARVYRARSLKDGKMVGIKVLRQRYTEDLKAVAQFRREAEFGKTLRHPNIVPIYDVLRDREYHFLTMEFVEGGNLRDFINIRKQVAAPEATKYVLEMALGLHYALGKGLTHRDMKMTNVLMSTRGVSKLVDFGLASTEVGTPSGVARGESAARAIEYATLEKGTGVPRHDPRTDLYFLGAIYYELLTGVPPLARTRDRAERSEFARYTDIRPIAQACPDLPREVVRIVERLMQVNPIQRYQTPGEVIVDLRPTLLEIGGTLPATDSLDQQAPPVLSPSVSAPSANNTANATTIMCIERRHKQQEFIRKFFSKRGYRVLILGDLQRGINFVRDNPPDCVLLMGQAIEDSVVKSYHEMVRATQAANAGCVLVLSEKQADLKSSLTETKTTRVLVQPITLRELHAELRVALGTDVATNGDGDDEGESDDSIWLPFNGKPR